MINKGYDVSLTYVADLLGNVAGGAKKNLAYDHSIALGLSFDLKELMGLSGYTFNISALTRTGQDLSKDIGNTFRPSSLYGNEEARLYGLLIKGQHMLQDGTMRTLKIGRISAGEDFNAAPIFWNFITNALDGNPVSVFFSNNFSTYPSAVWGAYYQIDFLKNRSILPKNYFVKLGIYDGDTTIGKEGSYGINFSLAFKNGLFIPFEIGYKVNQDKDSITNLPGLYKIGFYDCTGCTGDTLLTKRFNNFGGYLHAQQMVYREPDPDTKQGLTGFSGINLSPSATNKIPLFIFGGFIYEGLLEGRDQDITSLGVAYGRWSWDIDKTQNPKEYEVVFDLSYKLIFNNWLYVQPDLQYIISPITETGQIITNAFVIGTRVGITIL